MERCRLDFMSPCSKNPDRPVDYVTHRPSLKVRIVFVCPVSHEWDDFRKMSRCPSLADAYSDAKSSVLMFCSARWFLPPAKAVVLKYNLGRMVSGDCWQNYIDPESVSCDVYQSNCKCWIEDHGGSCTAARLGPLVDLMGMAQKNRRTNDSTHNLTRLKDCPIK